MSTASVDDLATEIDSHRGEIEALRRELEALRPRRRNLRRRASATAVIAIVGVLMLSGAVWASIPGPDGMINACYAKTGGTLRVIDKANGGTCKSTEKPLSWPARKAVVSTSSSCHGGFVTCADSNYAWITGSPVSVTLTVHQAVVIAGDTVLRADGGTVLDAAIGICAAPLGVVGGMRAIGGGVYPLQVDNGTPRSLPVSLTRIVKATALGGAGTYSVGLCYDPTHTHAASDEANVTTMVVTIS